ncbi:SOS response-associated peptidase [Yoonia sp.]|uniref:SOS response-associated peptidase n=1 Tax=Yoonia sp. TaxID=2212373 RepID=UPI0023852C6E|nr:SOS response-associated peptidase [Yoonia sp.]MDE0850299.1 SOS response-associated peptidase [Yoonia sp.]
MCGRMAFTLPKEAMVQLFEATPSNNLPEAPNYNVCPTVQIPVVTSDGDARRLRPMRWGFVPHWYEKPNGGPLLINARAETIAEKPAFRAACRARRCLIPVTGFYEWTRDGKTTPLPWFVQRRDGAPLVMAGIWQDWERGDEAHTTCAIVTTSANKAMARIHHRIPVILSQQDWSLWLGESGKGAALLMKSAPEDALSFHRVGTEVNSNRASGAVLLDPIV